MVTPAIETAGLRYTYPDGTTALAGIDLSIMPGESIAVLGPNGAGKSTFLLHLNGILRASDGSLAIHGVTVGDGTLREIRHRVGMVFQDPDDQLFMTTLYDDVAFGPLNMGLDRIAVDARVHEALHAVGLADEVSRPGQRLSFGQKKRAAIATVLSMSPDVLVLDEPSSNLDPRARHEVIRLLASIRATKVVATHDMDMAARLCDRAVIIDGGTVVADGTTVDILADHRLLREHGLEASRHAPDHVH